MRSDYQVLTPESVEFAYEVAGLGSRMLAVLIDMGVLVAGVLLGTLVGLTTAFFGGILGIFLQYVLPFAFLFGYFIVCEWRLNGQTVGPELLAVRKPYI